MSAGGPPLNPPAPTIDQTVDTFATPADCMTCEPLRNHIATLPPVSPHSQSALPSPSKSGWPTINQLVGAEPTAADCMTHAPFISHSAPLPLVLRQVMSLVPWTLSKSVSVSL